MKKELRYGEFKGLECRKSDDGSMKISGYAAVFNSFSQNLGGFREKISPGAFRSALEREDDIFGLWNHETGRVLSARSNGTLAVEEDERGLKFSMLLDDTTDGLDAFKRVKRGDVRGVSFAFTVKEDGEVWEYNENAEVRLERTIVGNGIERLYEVSPTAFPAYQKTSVSARSLEEIFNFGMAKVIPPEPAKRNLLSLAQKKLQIASC